MPVEEEAKPAKRRASLMAAAGDENHNPNAKKRRASLLEIQKQINAVVEQVGIGEEEPVVVQAANPRRKSLRISLLAENADNNVVWLDI